MCGIIGMINQSKPASPDTYLGLMAMQHRGKEGAGICTSIDNKLRIEKGVGELPQAFWRYQSYPPLSINLILPGTSAIGQVRYSTTGTRDEENLQPMIGTFRNQEFAIVHNGNLVNTKRLAEQTKSGYRASDTRVIADLISQSKESDFETAVVETIKILEGSFNLIFLFDDKLIVVKDRFGFHPMQIGQRESDYIVASESCALDLVGVRSLKRDVLPGEIAVISKDGISINQWCDKIFFKFDIFEYIYFLRPDSIIHGVEAGQSRYWMGYAAAEKCNFEADIVVPISDSGNEAALGFFESMQKINPKIKFRPYALFRPHIVSRTFIEPIHEKRIKALNFKFNPRPEQLAGKNIILLDDSIVRDHTAKTTIKLCRQAGAKKVFFVSVSPMYSYPDFYGIDTYREKNEIVARRLNNDLELIRQENGADGLFYNNIESVIEAIIKSAKTPIFLPSNFYTGPFTGEYPAGTGDFVIY